MDDEMFVSLIKNLLHANVTICEPNDAAFKDFTDKYCYNAILQPLFTAETLSRISCAAKEDVIYESRDEVGIWIQFFRIDGRVFLIGPYVKRIFDLAQVRRTFIALHIPAAYVASFQLYYSAFPLLSSSQVRSTIIACIRSLTRSIREYSTCRVELPEQNAHPLNVEQYTETLDYSTIYSRYDFENTFLNMVEAGDTDRVMVAYERMSGGYIPKNRYANAVYLEPDIGMAMVRALARKAAERGGASVIEINEITQRAVQHMLSAKDAGEQVKVHQEMIYELTNSVRRHRLNLGGFSAPIRKVLEYIQLNFSQKISLTYLAELANCSSSYLSKEFKKEVGTTIFEYIAHLRCTHAAEMLIDTDATIQEISSFVGYLDNNYFVKVFRREFGTTPSDYRMKKGRNNLGQRYAEEMNTEKYK